MKVVISNYSTDGSSLSDERCQQIVVVYELCKSLGNKVTSYRDIQDIAVKNKVFGMAKADSVIRTVFPLLKKMGFISYPDSGEFVASSFFTDCGKAFILTFQALDQARRIDNDEIVAKIRQAIQLIIRLGIANLSVSEYRSHTILLAIEILRREGEIFWNEILYMLSLVQDGAPITSALQSTKELRAKGEELEYYSLKGSEIKNTAYSYVRSLLVEAGIILSAKGMYSKLNPSAINFINSLPHYGY